jgi:hypothetical protein
VNLSSFFFFSVCEGNFHVSRERARQCYKVFLTLGCFYLHDVFAVGTTIAPKVDGRLYDRAEQTGP